MKERTGQGVTGRSDDGGAAPTDAWVIVSSTVFAPRTNDRGVVKSVYDPKDRLEQTRRTVESLTALGYRQILLADNSGSEHQAALEQAMPAATVRTFDHFQYDNKGISETILLLSALRYVPDDRPLVKLSGRYMLSAPLEWDSAAADIAARVYSHGGRGRTRRTMATRCYGVRDRRTYTRYLEGILEEMYAYSARILGVRSLSRFLTNQFAPSRNSYSFFNPILSVEAASLSVVRRLGLRLQELDRIGLSGLAGTFQDLTVED